MNLHCSHFIFSSNRLKIFFQGKKNKLKKKKKMDILIHIKTIDERFKLKITTDRKISSLKEQISKEKGKFVFNSKKKNFNLSYFIFLI